MALSILKAPVNYEQQQAGLEDFLANFKASPEQTITTALGSITINEDDFATDEEEDDDEDEVMADGANGSTPRGARGRRRQQQQQQERRQQRRQARAAAAAAASAVPLEKYRQMLQQLSDRKIDEFVVELDDLAAYAQSSLDPDLNLIESIERNAKHYVELASRAVDRAMPPPSSDVTFMDDVLDVLMARRRARDRELQAAVEQDPTLAHDPFPAELTRRYTLVFRPRSPSPSAMAGGGGGAAALPTKPLAVRHVRGDHLGHLITVRAIATRVSDVKPVVQVSAYACDRCGCEIFQAVKDRQYAPLTVCPSKDCKDNDSKGRLYPSTRASKFLPFQEVKVQELAEQVPIGQIPRTLTVVCLGSSVRRMSPGDVVDITGVFLPTPYTGFKALRAGLLTDTYLEAHHVLQHKRAYADMEVDRRLVARIDRHRLTGRVYDLLARSIAPEIYGHLDVKKALLLLLIGGCTKETADGMRIRGDINICLMGDPGVAKSQLLKYISKVAPRGVYTSGRGSSGVGLTAAVMRDPVTEEMVLEGGALVLADNGICCIDEFDKMDDTDRTAIHEVMEQQTISISKAGISTTLNARTSILAAANPLYGRYNPRLSPVENINLPAALLSRFDVLFLMLDTPARDTDAQLAKHVAYVHMHGKHPDPGAGGGGDGGDGADGEDTVTVFSPHEVRSYVARARAFRPLVPATVTEYMVKTYVRMREQQRRAEKRGAQFSHTSPRTLLGVVRLAQALARLRFSAEVSQDDVDESLRLIEASKDSLQASEGAGGGRHRAANASDRIYQLVKTLAETGACRADGSGGGGGGDDDDDDGDEGMMGAAGEDDGPTELSLRKVKERVIAKGFTEDQWLDALDAYADAGVWQTAGNATRLVFVTAGN